MNGRSILLSKVMLSVCDGGSDDELTVTVFYYCWCLRGSDKAEHGVVEVDRNASTRRIRAQVHSIGIPGIYYS